MCYALLIHLVRARLIETVAGEALQGVVAGEVGRLLCRIWDDDGSTDALLERTYGRNGAAIVGAPVRYSKQVFRDAFCFPGDDPRPGDSPRGLSPSGGQCLTKYTVSGKIKINATNAVGNPVADQAFNLGGTTTNLFFGPISGPFRRTYGSANNIEVYFTGFNADGTPETKTRPTSRPAEQVGEVYDLVYTRLDGSPDDCGESPDPRPRYDGPVVYPDGVSRPTTIIINNPQGNRGGRGLTVPFAWISPELNLNGKATINPKGEFEIDLNGGGDDNFAVDPNSPQPQPGPDSPPSPEGYREMRGVVVVTTKLAGSTTTTEYGNGESPNLYLPRCASLLFAVNVLGSGNWTQPVDIETLRQWVPVLGDLPAYLAVAKPMNGYSCQLFPVYVDDEKDEPIDDE